MEKLYNCPICSNQELRTYLDVTDHFGTKEVFNLDICSKCNTLLTNPRPGENEIIKYYKSNSYISHGDKVNPIFNFIYKQIQKRNLRYKKELIEKYTLDKNLLDYGCGTGTFLAYMSKMEWQTIGVEPDDTAKQIAISKGLNIKELTEIDSRFDCITLFHVLEHVHQLNNTLEELIAKLNRNGILILAVPNFNSHDASHYNSFWAGYDVPRHLYHFSQKSIFTIAENFGLNIVATHPMKFDSYYVSLLSEKYQKGENTIINAIINGYRSNKKALNTKEYSSLIYILSK